MQQVDPEAVTASGKESSFILQLRPSAPPDADPDVLARQIDQFVRLYLTASGLNDARFAWLAPLTWAISSAPEDGDTVERIRGDLCETLFARDDREQVRLVQQARAEDGPPPPLASERNDAFTGWEPSNSSAVTRAAMEGSSDVLDLDSHEIDIVDGDVFEVDAWNLDAAASVSALAPHSVSEPAQTEADLEPAFDALTETPDGPAQSDIATELAAFRAEMREIAASIPGAHGADAVEQFRSELESVTGALGQRVDGAAQRIESAAERVAATVADLPDAERMASAVHRAEASAQLMETSVRESVQALTAALKAMNGAGNGPESQAEAGL
jgi:hypothetical protein